ncbi:DNA_polymerase_eta (plasmid) [Leishmania braziliensis MHOM/BR/75/M2904]|uniref:DNA_polymerase_eta n=1 Tax=Leishmania braziliensis MHOM/BR/75/M2904 TaxID=420245 RepID=A0A3P3Z613_LEIBR|nr:DNA_polymerase_eta [Leishmania braziliensis MHOM/BR/75/M2904]
MSSGYGAGSTGAGEDGRGRSSLQVSSSPFSADSMRCIAHVDMDCFYAQVEAVRLGLDCRVTPFALLQWGNFIAVNYPARARGVKRFCLSPDEVRRELPDVQMSHIATYAVGESEYCYPEDPRINTHKVSLEPYRHASRQIFAILRSEPGVMVGKAGIDEAYVDVTEAARRELAEVRAAAAGASLDPLVDVMEPSTRLIEDRRAEMEAWLCARGTSLAAVFDEPMRALVRGECGAGLEGSRAFCVGADDPAYAERCLLLCAASRVVHRLRQRIYAELHYDCSAGIAHNRVLAKCISATHKPNQQTLLLPDRGASALFELPLSGLRGFGGKLGAAVSVVCGGVTECREAWLVPLAQLYKLDGTHDAGVGADAEEDGEGHVDDAYANCRRDTKASNAGGGGSSTDAKSGTGLYVFYRVRGFGSDTVADPVLPRGMRASKIFHPLCSSWSAAQLWMAPLAGELWHRFSEYESHYYKEGRSLVVVFRTYVTPEQVRRGQHTRSYRAQAPLPANVRDATQIADIGLREFVKLMREVTREEKGGEWKSGSTTSLLSPHLFTNPTNEVPDAPTGIAAPANDVSAMPPLRFLELSIIGLRVRPLPPTEGGNGGTAGGTDGGTPASTQCSLADMFAALSANATASAGSKGTRTAVVGGGVLRKRHRSGSRDADVTRGLRQEVVVEIDDGNEDESVSDDCVDVDVNFGEAAEGVKSDASFQRGQLARPAGASSPPLKRTLKDPFHRTTMTTDVSAAERAHVPTSAARQVTTVCVEEDDVTVCVPQQGCVSITEVSSEDETRS